ncbi:MAG: AI-2E family transporter [Enterobacteriaceae bacterium]
MLELLRQWYRRRFSDPQAVALLVILLAGFCIVYFLSGILAPLLVALVLAYLLEWPTHQLQRLGCHRWLAVSLVVLFFCGLSMLAVLVVAPTVWQQGVNLTAELPRMLNHFYDYAKTFPARYPALVDVGIIDMIAENLRIKLAALGDSVVSYSMASLMGLLTLAIYLILVPLMLFFLLKDKSTLIDYLMRILPRDHSLAGQVWQEVNLQISNYIRGKVVEIVIVGFCTWLVFWYFDLRYSLLLAVMVGLSVLIPYIGAVLVTLPIVIVALSQWGIGADFWGLFIAYLVIQALDGNLLVPVLFSEAVNLHPLVIILSVVLFGGLWGFWGMFFAIPLATLVKAVISAWPESLPES